MTFKFVAAGHAPSCNVGLLYALAGVLAIMCNATLVRHLESGYDLEA